ncbi:uncharacterized protein LOC128205821 isoform X2 [Mya arenaria]|uniref:uncharacterized protein LOC128205821 isoform X2 n=1 Tax=Mya arenaria TaxID=6604 RepID=UPI0022E26ABF|nr:uncharacterized protein LOC128205821 isoform X2 [Mya arenaria]XP_052763775.1 uncharacterized protein LOC128205821 isoform X2 [Mya arenaria]XP_052763776.1 uncharacterized protein LOC128205821 isoform X2 [Mya arenaria]XP_052763777.1 uncharacterized protein LOC128205821 isoform X2 [Mya arenaria]XP_052763778.1 uncharacterized protein LOC128205821 isoform X2 [Mya arenaria]
MQTSCCQIIGLILLVNTNLALIISFATPYWIEYNPLAFVRHNRGLWGDCSRNDCHWSFFGDDRYGFDYPAWFKATQGLMSVALALGLIALLVATLSLCCTCHSCNPHHPICGFLIIASVSIAVAIVVFGIKAKNEWGIDFQMELMSSGRFGWSFWTAVGAAASALLTSTIYCCMDRKRH